VSDGTQQGVSLVGTYALESELKGVLWLGVDKLLALNQKFEICAYATALMQRNPADLLNPKAAFEQQEDYIAQLIPQYYLLNVLNQPIRPSTTR
jgi:hypothetical protein